MIEQSTIDFVKNVIRENPEILKEFVNEKQDVKIVDPMDKPTEGRFMKFTPRQKERIEVLAPPIRKQAELIRQAVDIGLTELEFRKDHE